MPRPLPCLFALAVLAACGRVAPVPAATIRASASPRPLAAVERLVRDELEVDVGCAHVAVADVVVTRGEDPDVFTFRCGYAESCQDVAMPEVTLAARGTADMARRRVTLLALVPTVGPAVGTRNPTADGQRHELGARPSQLHRVRSAR